MNIYGTIYYKSLQNSDEGESRSIVAYVMNCDIVVSKFEPSVPLLPSFSV